MTNFYNKLSILQTRLNLFYTCAFVGVLLFGSGMEYSM